MPVLCAGCEETLTQEMPRPSTADAHVVAAQWSDDLRTCSTAAAAPLGSTSDAGCRRCGSGDRRSGRRRHLCRYRGLNTDHGQRASQRGRPSARRPAARCSTRRTGGGAEPGGRVTQRVCRRRRPRRLHHQTDSDRNGRRGHTVKSSSSEATTDTPRSTGSRPPQVHRWQPTTPSPSMPRAPARR